LGRHVLLCWHGLAYGGLVRRGKLLGTLPLRDVDGAFTELEHSLDTLRADGVILLGNHADAMVEAHRYLESSGQFGKIIAKRLKQRRWRHSHRTIVNQVS
jgi:hypothetical protein